MTDPNEILKKMQEAGFTCEENEDGGGFKPLSGEYVAVIQGIKRNTGEKQDGTPYDFISVSAQIEETIGGDDGNGRFVDGLTFPLTQDFGLPAFCNMAFTVGVELDKSNIDALLESAQGLIGKTANVRLWVKNGYQRAKVVKEFKATKKSEQAAF